MQIIKRAVAEKVRINQITNGNYVKGEGWDQSYLETSGKKISRVNIIGVVVEISNSDYIVDDGSGTINVRFFDAPQINLDVGNLVVVIGKPREFENTKYLAGEIIKTLDDPKWIELRKLELKDIKIENEQLVVEKISEEEPVSDGYHSLYEKIKNLDKGLGVNHDELGENSDDVIKKLLEQGDIFEVRPGTYKVLE